MVLFQPISARSWTFVEHQISKSPYIASTGVFCLHKTDTVLSITWAMSISWRLWVEIESASLLPIDNSVLRCGSGWQNFWIRPLFFCGHDFAKGIGLNDRSRCYVQSSHKTVLDHICQPIRKRGPCVRTGLIRTT